MKMCRAMAATLGLALTLSLPLPARGEEESREESSSPAKHGEKTEGDYIPDLVFARMVENPVSGITRVPVVNATLFGVPPDDRVANAFVLAPILPALFRGGWSLVSGDVTQDDKK